jgi:hypothetical protein
MKRFFYSLTFLIITGMLFFSCTQKPSENVIEVTAKDFYFYTQDTIPSGWDTFRFNNQGHAHHFFFLTLLPDNIGFQQYISELVPPFAMTMDSLKAGMDKASAGAMLGGMLPEWYASAKTMGGAGIIQPGKSEEITIKLELGNYVMECYVKTPEGKFHSELGMIRPIFVTAKNSGMKEPADANMNISLYNDKIETEGKIAAGHNVVAVHFKEHPQYGLGNDVHVVKLTDETDIDTVISWMNWMNVNGLQTPAPAKFMGGTQEMPVGYTSYFTVNLEPGKYAWISETAVDRKMLKVFTVD